MPPPDRLSALDLSFLDLETPTAPLHVGWTMRFEGAAPSLSALRRHIDGRLDAVPRFRRRIVRRALGLGDPHWADDHTFDIANHVHALTLAAPAGPTQLRELAGTLLSRPLDHGRPLWRIYLIDGLANGGFSLVGQAHHALVDGIAAIEVAMLLFDAEGSPPQRARAPRWEPTAPPSTAGVVRAGVETRLRGAAGGSAAIVRALSHATPEGLRDAREALGAMASPAPQTSLDRTETSTRLVAFADVSMAGAREAGHRHGATVNDVLLAAATLALGRALRRRGERPISLKLLVPVNMRGEGDAAELGNRISFLPLDVPVAETDPIAVLRKVRARTRIAKSSGAAGPLGALAEAADLLPGPARRALAQAVSRATPFNAVVSNMPGPPVALSLLGRRLTSIHPAVPILQGHSLAIGALSYRERLHVGLYADATVLPDVVEIARDLEAAFDALRVSPPRVATPWRSRARALRDQRAVSR